MADLTFRGTDIRKSDKTIFFDLVRGYSEPALVRGVDLVIPGDEGREVRNRVKDSRVIELQGYVKGSTAAAWRVSTDALMALLVMNQAAGALVLTTPYLGIASGTKTLNARCINLVGGQIYGQVFQTWSIELECVDSPPDWA